MSVSLAPFTSKVLVITGGTGTFGNAVLDRVLDAGLSEIRVLSRDEKKQDDMRRSYNCARLRFYVGDVRDPSTLTDVMAGADFLFHAAALKQVPSCEFFPMEAIRTNALGTDNVLSAAISAGVSRVVVLSTDKAAYPINAMGMTKALMEKIMVARSRVSSERGTIICGTRYGNVMGSRGSVIPLFIDQIQSGKALTVTEPSMTRFMMSIEDAVELVLFAFTKGEPGDLFVQKAPAATVQTLADAMLRVFGASNPVRRLGMRHGEKLYETLLTREEMARAEDLGDYFRVRPDARDLNYEAFFSQGEEHASEATEYHSHNTNRLDLDGMTRVLLSLPLIQDALRSRGAVIPSTAFSPSA